MALKVPPWFSFECTCRNLHESPFLWVKPWRSAVPLREAQTGEILQSRVVATLVVEDKNRPLFLSLTVNFCVRAPTGAKLQDCLEQLLLPNVVLPGWRKPSSLPRKLAPGALGMVGGGKRHQSKSELFPAAGEQTRNQILPFLPKLQSFPADPLLPQPAR